MKRYLSLLLGAAVWMTACNNPNTSTTETGRTDSTASEAEQNLAKNRSVYKAIETGDSATIRALIADDAVDHQGPGGRELRGGDSITHMLADVHNHMKDLKFDIISDAARGDYIFSMVQMTGTTTDATMGMPAGTKIDGRSADVVRVKNGKMVEHWGFMDPNDMMKQMGGMMPMDSTGKMQHR